MQLKTISFLTALTIGGILRASEEVTIYLKDLNAKTYTLDMHPSSTWSDAANKYKKDVEFAGDIDVAILKQTNKVDLNKTIEAFSTTTVRPSRKWSFVSKGSYIPTQSVSPIELADKEKVHSVRKKIKAIVKAKPNSEYFVVEITKNGSVLSDTDLMPSYQTPLGSEYGVTIDRLERVRANTTSNTAANANE